MLPTSKYGQLNVTDMDQKLSQQQGRIIQEKHGSWPQNYSLHRFWDRERERLKRERERSVLLLTKSGWFVSCQFAIPLLWQIPSPSWTQQATVPMATDKGIWLLCSPLSSAKQPGQGRLTIWRLLCGLHQQSENSPFGCPKKTDEIGSQVFSSLCLRQLACGVFIG